MNQSFRAWEHLEKLAWRDVLIIAGVFILARLVILTMRRILLRVAENAEPRRRLAILRISPILRLLIRAAAIVLVVPILVEPTVPNVLTLSAGLGLALAYTLKDYGSSVVAGFVAVMENTFQPGDWIELDGAYGEVKSMAGRAVHLVTTDDTEVTIPLSKIWSAKGVANFYLHPDHDASAVQAKLVEVAASSSYRAPDSSIKVVVQEKPWGTHYRVKAYVKESREQYTFTSDLTIRGKDVLRQMNTRFAQAPYAETGKS